MKAATYEFAEGARFQAGAIQNAAEVGKHLELLRKQARGELTPEDVLADARGHNSPLHSFFEWDDTAAAHQHRLAQARGLIRSVVAVYTSDDKPAVRTRAYIHVPEKGAPHYRDAVEAMSTKKTRAIVLQTAWREFQQFRQKYKHLKELADLFEAADEVGQRLLAAKKLSA